MQKITEKLHSELSANRNLFFVVFTFCMVATLSFFATSNMHESSAANLGNFTPGNIISDAVMSNYNAMSEQDIQNFLDSKNKCDNRDYNLYLQYTSSKPTISWHWEGEPYNGHFVCLAEEKFGETASEIGTGKTAARIIYEAAQANRINPQAILVLLQKESSLITDKVPNSYDYGQATGYGCPDTAACDKKYSGFSNQVHRAAELFRYVLDHNSVYYPAGRTVYVGYHPNSSCGGTQVFIENRATAALYQYTPYQPNASALAAGYGQGDICSAYGNRNFYLYFTDWFGSTQAAVDGELVDVPDGSYTLISGLSNQRTLGASSRNAQLGSLTDAETWVVKRDANGLYELTSESTNLPLSVDQAQPESGTNVSVRSTSTECAKKWKIYQTKDGYLTLESSCTSGFVLDVSGGSSAVGTNIQTYITNASLSQKWHLRASQTLDDGIYTVSSVLDTNKNLGSATTSSNNGVNVQLQDANPSWSQQWQLAYDESTGYYTIMNYKTNTILDLSGGIVGNGANIQLWSKNNSCAQYWQILQAGDSYTIASACNADYVLDLDNGGSKHGTNLQLWRANNTNAQRWTFAPVEHLEDGVYTISAKKDSTKVIDLANNRDRRGNNIQLSTKSNHWSQQWYLHYNSSDNTYTIVNSGAGENVIDINNSWMNQGTNIKLWSSNSSCAQKWILEPTIDGYYAFISSCDKNYAIDLDNNATVNGANIQLWRNNGTDAQKWSLQAVSGSANSQQLLPNGTYTLISKVNSKMGIDIDNAGDYNGANTQLWGLNNTLAQDWNLQYNSADDTYTFINPNTGKRVLDVDNGVAKRLANIQLWSSNSTCAQKWHLQSTADGYYNIASACSPTYVLDVENGLGRNGANIRLWENNGTDAQKWKLQYK